MRRISPSWCAFAFAGASVFALAGAAFAQTPAPAAAPTPAAAPAPGAKTTAPPVAPAGGPPSLIGAKCKDEIAKQCSSVPAGGGRLARCLRDHDADLGPDCKAALAAAGPRPGGPAPGPGPGPGGPGPRHGGPGPMGHHGPDGPAWGPMKDMQKACAADKDKFCKEIPPGHGRVAVCLHEHEAELAPACKDVVSKVSERMNEPMQMHADCAEDAKKLCSDVPPGMGRVGVCLGEHASALSPACKKHVDEMKAAWAKRPKAGGPPPRGPRPDQPSPGVPGPGMHGREPDFGMPGPAMKGHEMHRPGMHGALGAGGAAGAPAPVAPAPGAAAPAPAPAPAH